MGRLQNNGLLKEIKNGNNFELILEDSSYYAETDYRVMQSQEEAEFLKCMKIIRNGKTALFYLTENYRPVIEMKGTSPETFLNIAANVLAAVIDIYDNGFLNCKKIDITPNKIYVEANTLNVKLVYMPFTVNEWDIESDFDEALRTNIVEIINAIVQGESQALVGFVQDLCNRSISIKDVYKRLCDKNMLSMQRGAAVQEHVATEMDSIKLIAINATEKMEISITEGETLIGKKEGLVDKVISFNSAISRKHCRIISERGMFYVVDENSANGTFVNGTRLAPGQKFPLNRGDVLRLANSDFKVM